MTVAEYSNLEQINVEN